MYLLPRIRENSIIRPNHPNTEKPTRIADEENKKEFWEEIYHTLFELGAKHPLRKTSILDGISSTHGFYGYRTHPVTKEKKYFHLGIEIETKTRENIFPILPGILEYSGFGPMAGYYVLLSHPEIQTEDGYILHSMYCHMKKPSVKFNAKQKMLREISLGTYPIIPIKLTTKLGETGTSGKLAGNIPILYLQVDFRKFEHRPIVIDALRLFLNEKRRNIY